MDANYAHATWGASAALDLQQLWRDVAASAEAEEFTAVQARRDVAACALSGR